MPATDMPKCHRFVRFPRAQALDGQVEFNHWMVTGDARALFLSAGSWARSYQTNKKVGVPTAGVNRPGERFRNMMLTTGGRATCAVQSR